MVPRMFSVYFFVCFSSNALLLHGGGDGSAVIANCLENIFAAMAVACLPALRLQSSFFPSQCPLAAEGVQSTLLLCIILHDMLLLVSWRTMGHQVQRYQKPEKKTSNHLFNMC